MIFQLWLLKAFYIYQAFGAPVNPRSTKVETPVGEILVGTTDDNELRIWLSAPVIVVILTKLYEYFIGQGKQIREMRELLIRMDERQKQTPTTDQVDTKIDKELSKHVNHLHHRRGEV